MSRTKGALNKDQEAVKSNKCSFRISDSNLEFLLMNYASIQAAIDSMIEKEVKSLNGNKIKSKTAKFK
jgi:hypothetical protein